MKKKIVVACALCVVAVFPVVVQAKIEFTEVQYDPVGTDTGHEWLEIHNTSNEAVDVSAFRLFEEGVNHILKAIVGTTTLAGGEYAVIADDAAKFVVDWPTYSGTLFDSSFSLKNTGETLVLRGKNNDEDTVLYDPTIGAAGDGNTLQKQSLGDGTANWIAAIPTPGSASRAVSIPLQVVGATSTVDVPVETVLPVSTPIPVSVPVPTLSTPARSIPVEPQIFCKINGNKEVLAGVEVAFSGQSWGLKKQPLQNARYVWNFGDSQTREGQYVLHTYTQPGTYEVFLEIASDVYSATDRQTVIVRSPQLALSHSSEALMIANRDTSAVDLFGLKISQSGRPDFIFPEHSMVSGHGEMTIDVVRLAEGYVEVTRADEAPITLRYLNDRVVATSSARQVKPVTQSVKKTKIVKATKAISKPRTNEFASQSIAVATSSGREQVILLDTTAKERRLRYYGVTAGVLALLAFAWWYLLR